MPSTIKFVGGDKVILKIKNVSDEVTSKASIVLNKAFMEELYSTEPKKVVSLKRKNESVVIDFTFETVKVKIGISRLSSTFTPSWESFLEAYAKFAKCKKLELDSELEEVNSLVAETNELISKKTESIEAIRESVAQLSKLIIPKTPAPSARIKFVAADDKCKVKIRDNARKKERTVLMDPMSIGEAILKACELSKVVIVDYLSIDPKFSHAVVSKEHRGELTIITCGLKKFCDAYITFLHTLIETLELSIDEDKKLLAKITLVPDAIESMIKHVSNLTDKSDSE